MVQPTARITMELSTYIHNAALPVTSKLYLVRDLLFRMR